MHTIGFNRRTATKVRNGRVQRKNRHQFTTRLGYVIDRESPKKGFRHLVTKHDIREFVELIPDWEGLSVGLERIVLGGGDLKEQADGYYEHFHRERTGAVVLYAWHGDLWAPHTERYFTAHRHIYDLFRVPYTHEKDTWTCRFTEAQAKAFLLLHVFMHELGHHHDRMQYKQQDRCRGGEVYAEGFANARLPDMLSRYIARFGDPALAN